MRDPASAAPAPPPRADGGAPRRAPHATARRRGPRSPALDLRLDPGRRIALVGPSGAGKTTVTSLLLRFLDPEEGSVTIAGRDVREYRQEDVRRQFALAGQEAHVFAPRSGENLRIGRPDASDARSSRRPCAARGSGDWVASLPDGLDTLVGEDGTRLSGGQRQRLTLARALLPDAPVLVLDEPTAHVDPATARSLLEDVLDAAGDRTVLLITHRPRASSGWTRS